MKKNLLTLVFVITFLCFGATFASAKTSSSTENSTTVSKKISAAKAISKKIKALEAKCATGPCANELYDLIDANNTYIILCASSNYPVGCGGQQEVYLLQTAEAYENCLMWNYISLKNTDKKMNRNKWQESKV